MPTLVDSKTEKNLLIAFSGESQARNRYDYYASKAKKDGYVQICNVFEEIAMQERSHAKRLFKLMEGGQVEITAAFTAGVIGPTLDNLKEAVAGEHFEHSSMYPEFAATAREEGFDTIARLFESIAIAEKEHERRFLSLLRNVEEGSVFKKEEKVVWVCSKCGYTHEGEEAPAACPACAHPRAYFQVVCD